MMIERKMISIYNDSRLWCHRQHDEYNFCSWACTCFCECISFCYCSIREKMSDCNLFLNQVEKICTWRCTQKWEAVHWKLILSVFQLLSIHLLTHEMVGFKIVQIELVHLFLWSLRAKNSISSNIINMQWNVDHNILNEWYTIKFLPLIYVLKCWGYFMQDT